MAALEAEALTPGARTAETAPCETDLAGIAAELRAGNRVLMMVRHAERPHIDHEDPTFGSSLPITEEGCLSCLRFGEALKDFSGCVQFLASPLRRTVMTAEWIARGMGIDGGDIPTDERLGNATFYFANQIRVWEEFRSGRFFDKVFAYMASGRGEGFAEIRSATDALESWAEERFTAQLGIFATHDLHIGVFLHARGTKTDWTRGNWLRFLDSAAVIFEPDGRRRYMLVRAGLSERTTGV